MKFSVVIPCHDRLELLRKAVYTVLDQDECEICIFDNASTPSLENYIKELSSSRVHYQRTEIFLSVTESWNRAIQMATGDYITFLGDDDGLTPNYYSRVNAILHEFGEPDVIYSSFYQFFYPGVAPWAPQGYVSEIKSGFFFPDREKPFFLTKRQALKAVKGSLKLKRNFSFNMQAFIFKRTFLQRLQNEGTIFRSSYPDYYLANVAFAKASSILIVPTPLSIAGVSKASVGYTLFNQLDNQFEALLNAKLGEDPYFKQVKSHLLPGPLYNNYYLMCMNHVADSVKPLLKQKPSLSRYRRLQIYSFILETTKKQDVWNKLHFVEKLWAFKILILLRISNLYPFCRQIVMKYLNNQVNMTTHLAVQRKCAEGTFSCLKTVFDALKSKKFG